MQDSGNGLEGRAKKVHRKKETGSSPRFCRGPNDSANAVLVYVKPFLPFT